MTEGYLECLEKAVKSLQVADHIAYITYPMIEDKRLLLKCLESICESVVNIINAILKYEHLLNHIKLYPQVKYNLQVFVTKCAAKYGLNSAEVGEIISLLILHEKHKNSAVEFAREGRVVILSDNLQPAIIDLNQIRKTLLFTKKFLESAKNRIITNKKAL